MERTVGDQQLCCTICWETALHAVLYRLVLAVDLCFGFWHVLCVSDVWSHRFLVPVQERGNMSVSFPVSQVEPTEGSTLL